MISITVNINGVWKALDVDPTETFVHVLREKLILTGTKKSCGQGECGACTVLLNGEAVNSCLILAASTDGQKIITIEGLSKGKKLDPIQQAFIDKDASQCGYCTPGMIMSTKGLLLKKVNPDFQEIKTALSGNICRCAGYSQIIEAVKTASKNQSKQNTDTLE